MCKSREQHSTWTIRVVVRSEARKRAPIDVSALALAVEALEQRVPKQQCNTATLWAAAGLQ